MRADRASAIGPRNLSDRYPEPALYPRDAIGRARCRQLEAAADEIWFPPLWDLIEGVFYAASDGGRDAGRASAASCVLARQYDALDKELAGREFLCGAFSVADIGTFVMANAAATLGAAPAESHDHVRDWLARTRARPAVRREVESIGAYAANALAGAASR
jgi:glutathione S-transferase